MAFPRTANRKGIWIEIRRLDQRPRDFHLVIRVIYELSTKMTDQGFMIL
jgi:hypothetical protein